MTQLGGSCTSALTDFALTICEKYARNLGAMSQVHDMNCPRVMQLFACKHNVQLSSAHDELMFVEQDVEQDVACCLLNTHKQQLCAAHSAAVMIWQRMDK